MDLLYWLLQPDIMVDFRDDGQLYSFPNISAAGNVEARPSGQAVQTVHHSTNHACRTKKLWCQSPDVPLCISFLGALEYLSFINIKSPNLVFLPENGRFLL